MSWKITNGKAFWEVKECHMVTELRTATEPDQLHLRIARNLLEDIEVDKVISNSYRDFHAQGLDYINLHRSPDLTIKAYILQKENGLKVGQNIVNPHDHAYNFDTYVLDGKLQNVVFQAGASGDDWNQFRYKTPLNGTPSIIFENPVKLVEMDRLCDVYYPGEHYYLEGSTIHTIRALSKTVVMLLFQYRDSKEAKSTGTKLFLKEKTPPSLDGLYRKYSKGELEYEIDRLRDLLSIGRYAR